MKVRFNLQRATKYGHGYPDLTDGKIYEVEETIDWHNEHDPGETQRYMLFEDDDDVQVPYDVRVFDIVE